MESSTAGEGGDGDTETLLPTGGPAAVGGWPQPQPRLARTGGGPSLARGIPCALLCPSSAFFSFLLRRCFTEELYLPPTQCPGLPGGLALALLRVGVWGHCWLSPGCPLPQSRAFPGSLPTAIPPGGVPGRLPTAIPPWPAPGVPVGAGAAGDDGKWESKQGHGRDSDAGGLSHCRGGNSWGGLGSWCPGWAYCTQAGLLIPRLGSQYPGWAHSTQDGLTAPRLDS